MKIFLKILFVLSILGASSCGRSEASWDQTADGVKIYHNSDQELISKTSISWKGDTTFFGLAHGKGVFIFTDEYDEKNNFSKKVTAVYGSIEELDKNDNFQIGKSDDKNRLNGFGVRKYNNEIIIGTAKKGEFKGEGVILKNDVLFYRGNLKKSFPDGEGVSYYPDGKIQYQGKWQEGLYDGEGVSYYPDGKIQYKGKWKKGNYNGYGELFNESGEPVYKGKWKRGTYNGLGELYDSSGLEIHVWKNGILDETTKAYYEVIEKNRDHFTSEQYKALKSRALSWERYHTWYYILIWISTLFILFIFFAVIYQSIEEDPYMKEKPWSLVTSYLLWLFFGIFGMHRAYLRSKYGYLYIACIGVIVAIETRDICHFLFWPSTWFMWHVSIITICLAGILGLMLLIDLFWIPWRVYVLNHKYYYSNRDEDAVLKGLTTPSLETCRSLPVVVNEAKTTFPLYLKEAQEIKSLQYSGKTNMFSKIGRAIINDTNAVEFETNKLKSISSVGRKATNLYNKFAHEGELLNTQLDQQRVEAKKNLDIVSKLFKDATKYKNKKRKVNIHEHQVTQDIKLDEARITNEFYDLDLTLPEIGVNWNDLVEESVTNVKQLMTAGISTKWSMGIGIGVSVLSNIANAVQRENQIREQVVKHCAEVVSNLKNIISKLTKTEANMLIVQEILAALSKANEAFTKAYVPIRNQIYGNETSLRNFMRGDKALSYLVNNPEFMREMKHLKDVCVEYNKINKATIK